MIEARFVPIDQWPGKVTAGRKRAPFSAPYPQTLDLLEYELARLYAHDILIQAYLRREDIRNDGWPRADAKYAQPGVIVSFKVERVTMSFPCDTFTYMADNLRAIALALEALRKVDRYGVTRNNEQYRGFAQIAAPDARAAAVAFLARVTGVSIGIVEAAPKVAYRLAAAALHTDNQDTGDHEQFLQLQAHWKAISAD